MVDASRDSGTPRGEKQGRDAGQWDAAASTRGSRRPLPAAPDAATSEVEGQEGASQWGRVIIPLVDPDRLGEHGLGTRMRVESRMWGGVEFHTISLAIFQGLPVE